MDSHSCEHWRSDGDNWSSAGLVANPGEILRGSEDPHVTQYASRNFAIEHDETHQRQNILIVLKLISNESSLQADGPCVAHVAKLNVNLVLRYLCNPQALQSCIGISHDIAHPKTAIEFVESWRPKGAIERSANRDVLKGGKQRDPRTKSRL